MAAFDTTRPSAVFSVNIFARHLTNIIGAVTTWNDARTTRNSLSKLSARELEDIGICYGDIDAIARRTTR